MVDFIIDNDLQTSKRQIIFELQINYGIFLLSHWVSIFIHPRKAAAGQGFAVKFFVEGHY